MPESPERLNLPRTFKIGSFHIGSAFSDILTSAIWNRVLISNMGISATPVALLSALRYFMAPLSIWAGNRSDNHPLFGRRRLPYIWGGRFLMVLGLLFLPFSTMQLAENPANWAGWLLAIVAFLIYGFGTLLSGSPFLALVRESAPASKRGQALSIIQIMLVVAMAISPGIYGAMMQEYDPATFWQVILTGIAIAIPFWFFSLLGEDKAVTGSFAAAPGEEAPRFGEILRQIWQDPRARGFFIFLAMSSIFAWTHDAVLEPFGGDVFGLDVGATTMFNMYWGVGVLIGMVGTTIVTRKRAPAEQSGTAMLGLGLTAVPLLLLGFSSLTQNQALLIPTLAFFGFAFGIFTVGAIGLLMAMTSDRNAGAYLGMWTVAQLVFRGVGIAAGGLLRDLGLLASSSLAVAYATVFVVSAIGLLSCIVVLARVDVIGFARGERAPEMSPLAALAD